MEEKAREEGDSQINEYVSNGNEYTSEQKYDNLKGREDTCEGWEYIFEEK